MLADMSKPKMHFFEQLRSIERCLKPITIKGKQCKKTEHSA